MGVLRRSEVDVPRPARLRIGLVRLVLAIALRVVCDETQRLAQAQLPCDADSVGRAHAGGKGKKKVGRRGTPKRLSFELTPGCDFFGRLETFDGCRIG